jgi:hypothetical protein
LKKKGGSNGEKIALSKIKDFFHKKIGGSKVAIEKNNTVEN